MSRKGFCWNTDGTMKVKHEDLAEAYQHAWDMKRVGTYEPYKCPGCKFYHVGRRTTNPWKLLGEKRKHTKQLYEEILVGKLIGVLRKTNQL